ncbi:MAG: peptidoglycan editing factor PgeF [Anaerolineaceae bacterium]|nr:peptidoglycan editing factor PgeF [Anaerolineaceae bacterium]
MPIHRNGSIQYVTFDLFDRYHIPHGIFMRHGGVSPAPWNSLNVGGSVGDEAENHRENLARIFASLGRDLSTRHDVWQVHGKDVLVVRTPKKPDADWQRADGMVTDQRGITLLTRFADCVPILLFDPVKEVVGAVHAGWQGTVQKIPAEGVRMMVTEFGCDPKHILAGIGPSIGPDDYEVGESVMNQVRESFGENADRLLTSTRPGHALLDLWEANRLTFAEAGVEQVEIAGISTYSNVADWFSHRKEQGQTGRFASLIALPDRKS